MIGDGESRAFLEKKVTDLGASSSIYFHGFVTDRDSISNLFDVLVVSSQSEGLSIAILEAMKMEIDIEAPCVGTISSIKVSANESVEEGQTLAVIS